MTPRIDINRNVAEVGATQINNVNVATNRSNDDIDRACLRALRCPVSFATKNRLKENKDKLLQQAFDWILRDPQYVGWQDGKDIGLLWIKDGPGKGRTMMSIGLIEELYRRSKETTAVTYFFCQNADCELNTVEAIVKGLIQQLPRQQDSLKRLLRDRWDVDQERYNVDVRSWRGLWNIFLEMLDRCTFASVYVVIDALDECRGDDSAERELLAGSDQVGFSLELNAEHIAQAVRMYISSKVAELNRRWSYGSNLRHELEQQLSRKAEDTFLWVCLVCKRLESTNPREALATVQDLPPDLYGLYHRAYTALCADKSPISGEYIQLLTTLMLAFRPLNVYEISSLTGLSNDWQHVQALIGRSTSFITTRGLYIEFVHQSARDFLAGSNGQSPLGNYKERCHHEMAMRSLAYLSRCLNIDLLDVRRPDTTKDIVSKTQNMTLTGIDYATTFWCQHLHAAKDTLLAQKALAADGCVTQFLNSYFLQWLECCSWLNELPRTIQALQMLSSFSSTATQNQSLSTLSMLVQDATRFLLRHYATISRWPLQVYSSAIVFSPRSSTVRRKNLCSLPRWLVNVPSTEEEWTALRQTLEGHSAGVNTVDFSPDGRWLASGSEDGTTKVWDASTGEETKTLKGHSARVYAVDFSPDGRWLASGSEDGTIKLWDASIGGVTRTLKDHSAGVNAVAFSPDGRWLVSGSWDETIKVWDASIGEETKMLRGHSAGVCAVIFSPDGRWLASVSWDETIKVRDASTGEETKTLKGHSARVIAVVFSPDGRWLALASLDKMVKVWDANKGEETRTLEGHSARVNAVAFYPDGRWLASGSEDKTIKVWDASTGEETRTLEGHSARVCAVAFSPDSRWLASGSEDGTIKVWDVQQLLEPSKWLKSFSSKHRSYRTYQEISVSGWVSQIQFSADSSFLTTNCGFFAVETGASQLNEEVKAIYNLYLRDQWIYYSTVAIFRLTSAAQTYRNYEDQLAIGYTDGQVLFFKIDRRSLQADLGL